MNAEKKSGVIAEHLILRESEEASQSEWVWTEADAKVYTHIIYL